jgi:hypothetical protein
MRFISAGLILCALVAADAPGKRFGVEVDPKSFPQGTPQLSLASVLKAIEMKRTDYILAQLADPQFVDRRVKETSYDELLGEATAKLVDDPGAAKQLRAFLKDGKWDIEESAASLCLKDGSDRSVSFCKAEGRWFMKQPYKKPAPKSERP